MQAAVSYPGASEVATDASGMALRLAPNLLRDRTHLVARLRDPLAFRDAMLALHDVARSELFVTPGEIEARQLDPVITVAPDEVYFEAFSLDESTYGRVTVRPAALADVERQSLGTTNVEFSRGLRLGLEGLRARSSVTLRVAAEGFRMADGERAVEEKKIDLADSWIHGFLAVQAAVGRRSTLLTLHPGDIRNVVQYLRARKEAVSPRSLRFRLAPGRPPSVLVEPWDETIDLARSTHDAAEDHEVRVWGRRRLLLLAQALPGAKAVRARLQGTGLPSFWTIDMGGVALQLGLSPWCERDWASMEPLPIEDDMAGALPGDVERAAIALGERRRAPASLVGTAIGRDERAARGALDRLSREGRALYDDDADVYVARRLFLGTPPVPPASLGREEAARAIVAKGGVLVDEGGPAGGDAAAGARRWCARVTGRGTYEVTALLGADGALVRGACACPFFSKMGFVRGPCKHLLALARFASRAAG